MFFDLYLLRPDDASDDAMLIGEECSAEHAHYRLAIHFLLAIHSESLNKTLLSVANEGERQAVFLYEPLVAFRVLRAHAYHGISLGEETLIVVAKVASLVGASWRGVARINVKHQLLAAQLGKGPFLSVLVNTKDLWQFLSYFQNRLFL